METLESKFPPSAAHCCSGLNYFAHSIPDLLKYIISSHFHLFPGAASYILLLRLLHEDFNSQPSKIYCRGPEDQKQTFFQIIAS